MCQKEMDTYTVHDDKLFEILKECRNLHNFLDAMFGFLSRRTDFYCISSDPNSPVGIPEGVAEQCVRQVFYKWKRFNKDFETQQNIVPHAIKEVVIDSTGNEVPYAISEVIIDDTEAVNVFDSTEHQTTSHIDEYSTTNFTSSESYNGGIFNNYTWSQTITDIDMFVKVPPNVTSKDIIIQILPKKIAVKLKSSGDILLEGDFCEKVKHSSAIWSLDKQKLEIHLDKVMECWWNCLVTQEPKINIQNIDCSRPYEELTPAAQAKIEELTWNHEQRRLGLPTSDDLVMQNKLKRAWKAEGSPFKTSCDL